MDANGKARPGTEPECSTPAPDLELKRRTQQANTSQARSPKGEPPPERQKIARTLRCLRPD
jgi:hypothetical protein